MNMKIILGLTAAFAFTVAGGGTFAAPPPSGLVPGTGSATFRFRTEVQSAQGRSSGSGTIAVDRTGPRAVTLTVRTDDGKPPHTIALSVAADGSVAPDAAVAPPSGDANAEAQAAALIAEMTIAEHVGSGARKSAGAASFIVPIKLTPVGEGTPVSTQLSMSGTPQAYAGHAQGQTLTVLPQNGDAGSGGPIKRRKRKEAMKAASGPLPDALSLSVNADFAGDRIREIRGVQVDALTLQGKPIVIQSTWSFANAPN